MADEKAELKMDFFIDADAAIGHSLNYTISHYEKEIDTRLGVSEEDWNEYFEEDLEEARKVLADLKKCKMKIWK